MKRLKVGAHGTGASLPPIGEQVVSMKQLKHAEGTIELSRDKDPELLYLADWHAVVYEVLVGSIKCTCVHGI
ncbi:uncharacterized protein A4U43_UnF1750 [Asparagus officinalis]|uniref:Uncharacterized protein n=1 Tax=Asparagus officinalis TaxID=4686 RepID=A0A1R3L7E8_ASPOF|nr:uncharacterized protein A4U43_UnF1750 [Asparagus officinalis]